MRSARRTTLYVIWEAMRQRCRNPNHRAYKHYGARGIAVCERWDSFENFEADIGQRPSPAHTLDRIDNNGDYEPGNVRWATRLEQGRNKRNNRLLLHNGKRQSIAAWSDETGLSSTVIRGRLARGWDVDRTLAAPLELPVHVREDCPRWRRTS